MIQIENKKYTKGFYISKGLGTVIFLFYFAIFVTVTLLSGHFSLLIYERKTSIQNHTCSILSPSLNVDDEKTGTSHGEFNIYLLNFLTDNSIVNGSSGVNIHLKNGIERVNLHLKNLKLINMVFYDSEGLDVIDRTDVSRFQMRTKIFLKKGDYMLCFHYKENFDLTELIQHT